MANHTVAANAIGAHDIALTPNTVETVTFSSRPPVEVISDGAATVYYTLDGSDPTIGGDNCYELPQGVTSVDSRQLPYANTVTVVKLISTGSPTVSVQRGN